VTIHVVLQGEHASSIAARHGFETYEPLWAHPRNAALRRRRGSPHVLFPGDELFLPDREESAFACATEQAHRFRLQRRELALRVVLLDEGGDPIAAAPCALEIEGRGGRAVTSAEGMVERPIASTDASAKLSLQDLDVAILIGHLDPVTEPSGWQARLQNLGYYDGSVGAAPDARLRLALEELQLEHGLPITGEADAATQAGLLEAHGS
jgi:hypothetical protein